MAAMKVGIIGAGPAGLAAAYRLAQAGTDVTVLEAADAVGGLARSIRLWGQTVDLGPHRFFSSDARVNRVWLEVIGTDYRMVDRLTRILYRGRFFDYPLTVRSVLKGLGVIETARALLSYAAQRLKRKSGDERDSFESWVVQRFGRRLYEMFFKTYTEKLWGIPCSQLDVDFAAQRIRKLSLSEAVKNALGLGRGSHRTLLDQFAYPLQGTGRVYERMAACVSANGQVRLNTPAHSILREGSRITGVRTAQGENLEFDHVISTMPLTLLVRALGQPPAAVEVAIAQLKFRNTILVYLQVQACDLFPDQWIYVHSPELQTGRITNFRNWVPELYGDAKTTIVALEFWCFDEDPLWTESDESLIARAKEEFRRTRLAKMASIIDGKVVRLPRCYPIYRLGYKRHLAVVVEYLRTFDGLTAIGRYGSFKYNNQDHSILMGILAAENLVDKTNHDLWSINSDYESYQEAALITESGLEPIV